MDSILTGIPSKVEIAGLFDEAFNRLYMQNYNVSIVSEKKGNQSALRSYEYFIFFLGIY